MFIVYTEPHKVWTVAEAKARLSEVLRLAREEGPQRIGTKETFVVVPEQTWRALTSPRKPLGRWLIETMPRGEALELPERKEPQRPVPFLDEEGT
jgi:prevent-host-death family protein